MPSMFLIFCLLSVGYGVQPIRKLRGAIEDTTLLQNQAQGVIVHDFNGKPIGFVDPGVARSGVIVHDFNGKPIGFVDPEVARSGVIVTGFDGTPIGVVDSGVIAPEIKPNSAVKTGSFLESQVQGVIVHDFTGKPIGVVDSGSTDRSATGPEIQPGFTDHSVTGPEIQPVGGVIANGIIMDQRSGGSLLENKAKPVKIGTFLESQVRGVIVVDFTGKPIGFADPGVTRSGVIVHGFDGTPIGVISGSTDRSATGPEIQPGFTDHSVIGPEIQPGGVIANGIILDQRSGGSLLENKAKPVKTGTFLESQVRGVIVVDFTGKPIGFVDPGVIRSGVIVHGFDGTPIGVISGSTDRSAIGHEIQPGGAIAPEIIPNPGGSLLENKANPGYSQ